MDTQRRRAWGLGLTAAVTALWWFARTSPEASPGKSKPTQAIPVVVAKASIRDVPVLLEITGRTEAFETVTVKSRVEGQVQNVAFAAGQHVRQGERLLNLDPVDLQARLGQAQANQARSQALLAKARADVDRYAALRAKGFVSNEKVSEITTAAAAAEAAATADIAATEIARLQLSYTAIRAPIDGIIGARLVYPGAAVRAGDTALAIINRVRPLHVGFAIPEKYLPALQAARRGNDTALAVAISLPGSDETFAAQLRFVDNGVDASTGTIALKAVFGNEQERLTSGQFVNVSLTLDISRNAVVVPAEAVQQGANGSFVFVLKADNTVEIRPVGVSRVQRSQAVIATGLSGDDTVVTEGQLRLTAGASVKLPDPTKTPG